MDSSSFWSGMRIDEAGGDANDMNNREEAGNDETEDDKSLAEASTETILGDAWNASTTSKSSVVPNAISTMHMAAAANKSDCRKGFLALRFFARVVRIRS
mmetsp:Transcript_30358/g.71599  ORF Transcript_30358/g.71599 Transcript_30358/m.71599 type:complete len:100 (-) Transcript_30358:481-780(-)